MENIGILHELNYLKYPGYKNSAPNKTWRLKKKINLQSFCAVVIVKVKERGREREGGRGVCVRERETNSKNVFTKNYQLLHIPREKLRLELCHFEMVSSDTF